MELYNFLTTKLKNNQLVSYDDVSFNEKELNEEIILKFFKSENIKTQLNLSFKEVNKKIKEGKLPNYDSYLCNLIWLYEHFDFAVNKNLIEEFIKITTPFERIGIPSFCYIWFLKFAIHRNYGDEYFWLDLEQNIHPNLKYLCSLTRLKKLTLDYKLQAIKRSLKDYNCKDVIKDLTFFEILSSEEIQDLINSIREYDITLYDKIKKDFVGSDGKEKKTANSN